MRVHRGLTPANCWDTAMWKYFVLGLLAGWLIEWVIDWLYWRRTPDADASDDEAVTFATAARVIPPQSSPPSSKKPTPQSSSPPLSTQAEVEEASVVEPNAGATTSADTPAGRIAGDVALGAPGAVSTSSATLTTNAPVYRQEDLEAIAGIGPKIGAMLRNNGITTFAELAATPVAELVRIVESTGESAGLVGLESWAQQATLAAAQDWAGLASLKRGQPVDLTRGEA
jgi:predicted flap endonuclease-1-like 5' DNA nuclease